MKSLNFCSHWNKRVRYMLLFAGLLFLVLFFLCLNISIGSVRLSFWQITEILAGKGEDDAFKNIVWQIRIPRAIAAAVLGGALALSGYLLQTFFHNPIAGPFVLGISSGAKLMTALVMVCFLGNAWKMSSFILIFAAFGGAMLSMGFVLAVSAKVRQASMLVVSGVMIGYICSAITDLVVAFADDSDIVNLHNWSMGSFSGTSWNNVAVMALVTGVAAVLTFLLSKPVSAYQMGEAYAANMGVDIRRFRMELVLLSGILSACVTAFAGPVSFVGIAVPQIIKPVFRTARPMLVIPACFLGGAVWCLFCDLLARTIFAPTELSISTVTAIFGAPVVICVMIRKKRESLD